jgi:hypothetical protein
MQTPACPRLPQGQPLVPNQLHSTIKGMDTPGTDEVLRHSDSARRKCEFSPGNYRELGQAPVDDDEFTAGACIALNASQDTQFSWAVSEVSSGSSPSNVESTTRKGAAPVSTELQGWPMVPMIFSCFV